MQGPRPHYGRQLMLPVQLHRPWLVQTQRALVCGAAYASLTWACKQQRWSSLVWSLLVTRPGCSRWLWAAPETPRLACVAEDVVHKATVRPQQHSTQATRRQYTCTRGCAYAERLSVSASNRPDPVTRAPMSLML